MKRDSLKARLEIGAAAPDNCIVQLTSTDCAALLKLLPLVKKLADASLPFGDEPHDIDDMDVLNARSITSAVEGT